MNYYNECDPHAAAWLRVLIEDGLIPKGHVDERPIQEVIPADLAGFIQCHFFAGIGGWSLALQLAGWPEDWPVWTGSCPCQPFSNANRAGKGTSDCRHLWPYFKNLIVLEKPSMVFGEQVASPAGREWLAGVFADLEGMGYWHAGADLCAAGIGSPQVRPRLWWSAFSRLSDPIVPRLQGRLSGWKDQERQAFNGRTGRCSSVGYWDTFDTLPFKDGKTRRIEPGTFPLVDGFPARVAVLKGLGNSICPPLAAEFITAASEAMTMWLDGTQ